MLSTDDLHYTPVRPGNPIQLLRKKKNATSNEELEIIPEALEILGRITGPIVVVAVVGTMRQGKSYLLSRMLGRQEAFELGPTTDPKTFGIWTWDTPYEVTINDQKATLILLDTEGLGAPNATEQWDTKIFVLSLLLSSLFIYNTRGAIDREAIQKLRIMQDLTRLIESSSEAVVDEDCDDNAEQFSEYFPEFLWVVRDFNLKYPEGVNTAKEYLLRALRSESDTMGKKGISLKARQEIKDTDEIRKSIVYYFGNADCHTMPLPVSNPEESGFVDIPTAMQNLHLIPYERLSMAFRSSMDGFLGKAGAMMNLKRFKDGSLMTGASFAQLLQVYVRQINTSNCIKVADAYQAVVDQVTKKAIDLAISNYRSCMESFENTHPNEPVMGEFLISKHIEFYKKSLDILNQNLLGSNEEVEKVHLELKEMIIQQDKDNRILNSCVFSEFHERNSALIVARNEMLVNDIWQGLIGKRLNGSEKDEFTSYQEFIDAIGAFQNEYERNCFPGVEAKQVFLRYLEKVEESKARLNMWFKQKGMFEERLAKIQEENLQIQKQANRIQIENESLIASMKRIHEEHEASLNMMWERIESKHQEAEEVRNQRQLQFERQQEAFIQMRDDDLAEFKQLQREELKEQERNMQRDYDTKLKALQEDHKRLEAENQQLKAKKQKKNSCNVM
ncbi:hypothetical protein K7432_004899 [Basidiobolus ranarum]|uniref:GB1/RHD3-type G domain-containing protein n=1 Tax=Basidiobolus ranarum TaxID=34480 RepID=A0ABR2WXF4_9FUNG